MRLVVVAAALVVVPLAAALPAGSRHFFPLERGNQWTFENVQYGSEETIAVTRANDGVFRLENFPGAPSFRIRWLGQTLQAWDTRNRRWEALLRFGAPVGTSYNVDLAEPLWSRVRVTVASRRATVKNPAPGRTHAGTIRFTVRPDPDLADAGLTGIWFAPGVGPVRWVEESIAGPVEHVLTRAEN
jgi:hypothetical protein